MLKNILKNISLFRGPAGDVFRGMATLAMGAVVARIIGVASILALTRIYDPADFGVLSVFTALIALLVPVLTLRYVVAVPLPRTDGMAMNLMALSALLLFTMTAVIAMVLWAFGTEVLSWMSMEVLADWWGMIALGALGTGTYEILSMWATRRRSYKIIAKTQVTQSVMGEAVKIGMGLLMFQPIGLILGQIVGQSAGIGSFIIRFREDFKRLRSEISFNRMAMLAGRHRGFPIYRLPSQMLLNFSMQAPLLFSAALFDAQTTGQLGLALMALALPMNLIGGSMSKAFYAEISGQISQPIKMRDTTYSVQKRLFLLGAPATAVLFFFGETIFSLAFGAQWNLAGQFAAILSISLLLQFTSAPLMQALNIYGRQSIFLGINILRSGAFLAMFAIAQHMQIEAESFVFGLSILQFLFYGGVSAYILGLVNRHAKVASAKGLTK